MGEGSQSQCLRSETAAPPHILAPRLMQQKKKRFHKATSLCLTAFQSAQFTGLEVPLRLDVKLVGFQQRGGKVQRDYSPIMEAGKGNIRNLTKFKCKEISSAV